MRLLRSIVLMVFFSVLTCEILVLHYFYPATLKQKNITPSLLKTLQQQSCFLPNSQFNSATGFNLTCPCTAIDDMPSGIRQVHLFYHVGMINNWKEIVEDQMTTLDVCGLGHLASSLTITFTNGEPQELRNVLAQYKFVSKVTLTLMPGPNSAPWEFRAMQSIYDTCDAIETEEQRDVIFYFHNKGASKYSPTWRDAMNATWSYSRSLYWRKYMEYFLLERPGLCLNLIANGGASACGVELHEHGPHYSGNFWATTCYYVSKNLKRMNASIDSGYTTAEFWIGTGFWRQFVGLLDLDWNLYDHLVLPEEYAIQNESEVLAIISSISFLLPNGYFDSFLDRQNLLKPVIG
jgi:hypothetical protein